MSAANMNSGMTLLTDAQVPQQVAQQVESADGARAIEVAALFDDAVLEVRHFHNPAGGRLGRFTKALLGTAGAALLGTGALFAQSYAQVVAEKAQAEAGRPVRAKNFGHARDGAAAGLLFYGIGGLLYGLYRAKEERQENEFSIGSATGTTFKLSGDGLPAARFPLVRSNGTDYEFLFTESMTGALSLHGQVTTLADLKTQAEPALGIPGAHSLAIPDGGRLALKYQNCEFLIRSVPRPRHYPVPLQVDWRAQSYTGAVLAGAASLLGLMFAMPPDPRSLALDSFSNEQLVRYLVKAPEVKEETAPWLQSQKQEAASSSGRAAKEKSGQMGKPEALRRTDARSSFAGPKNNPDPKLAQKAAAEAAKNVGVLGILHSGNVAGLTALLGDKSALGNEAENALGNINGLHVGDGYGHNGLGLIGYGPGGDGPGDNTIGLNLTGTCLPGTLCSNGNRNGTYGSRPPAAKLTCKNCGKAPPAWHLDPPTVVGYDKDLIRRVVRQHMNEVKFCYEKELQHDNGLSGRVVVKFSIGGMGGVTTSFVEASTLPRGQTDQCIANAVRRWQFPKPQQNGLVVVSYPFVLKTAAE